MMNGVDIKYGEYEDDLKHNSKRSNLVTNENNYKIL